MTALVERFLRYIKVNTQSDETTGITPSTKGQLALANILEEELNKIGLQEVVVSEYGYVYATLPSNLDKKTPVIGFIAHMDTSPDMSGENVNPQIFHNYQGGDIVLNKNLNVILSPKQFPEVLQYKGNTLITTDGTTLLGADDKAGIAEIITAIEYLKRHPEIKHGKVRVAFTPDEEIGEGANHFDVKYFGADFAYTIDGGAIGELEYENFNAAGAKVKISGRNVHPGYAKNKMINSMLVANEFLSMLPSDEVPEKTENYEGFFHLTDIKGSVEETFMSFIIRDFFEDNFSKRKGKFKEIQDVLNKKYGEGTVDITIKEQYKNMKEKIEPVMHMVETAIRAMKTAGVKPKVKPIRGGTDGARLSFMGLPTPNIFAGGENFHGKYEYIPIESMNKSVEVILNIISSYAI
ncbi:peptidase T [Clostridium polyendosporum]|uniref:Peptidase T n=1 Tax=Clostridium polyendosporum TaxID=69208 RepID=A0A919S0W3_9CLOT|nr:peptidase T [Clostridium polyendosporum]GIM29374.1 peptidase T [Clostridium polyendosporum]